MEMLGKDGEAGEGGESGRGVARLREDSARGESGTRVVLCSSLVSWGEEDRSE